jgi:hypothetical protein
LDAIMRSGDESEQPPLRIGEDIREMEIVDQRSGYRDTSDAAVAPSTVD